MNYRLFFSAVAMTLLLSTACVQKDRVVEYPLIESANTMTLDFSKVELTDTATILHTDAYYRPNYWIRIDSKSYLKANGKKYALKGTQGIEVDSLFWMPDSGEASFTLIFEPMPKNTKKFDFIESDCDDCFKLFGIDLTGKKSFDERTDIPEEIRKTDPKAPLPYPAFKSGETTLNIHFLGYRKEFGTEVGVYVNTMFGNQEEYNAEIDTLTGIATIRFMQYGPANVLVAMQGINGQIWVAPGEETEVYLDSRRTAQYIHHRRQEKKGQPLPELRDCYTSGTYQNLNNTVFGWNDKPEYRMQLYNGKFGDYEMSADAYTQFVIDQYHTLSASIDSSEKLTPMDKKIQQLTLKQTVLAAITIDMREFNYRSKHQLWDRNKKVEGIDSLKPEHVAKVFKLVDINDPKLLLGLQISDYIYSLQRVGDLTKVTDLKEGFAFDLQKVIPLKSKAENMTLTDADIRTLKDLKNSFFLEAFQTMQQKAKEQLAAVGDKAKIEETLNVSNEKLFEAIIAPHKGKVILVDFWNTWCGPCRASIEANEPLKSGELKSDDLVWIYIANETSPILKYKTMIPRIKGIHYRLNDSQWQYLCEKFKIDGIPSYVLVDKDGKYGLRNDFRNHELMKNTLKDMIH